MTKLFLSSISLAFIGSGAISTFFIGAASAQSAAVAPAATTGTEAVVTPDQYNPAIDVHADGGANGDGTGPTEAKVVQASAEGDSPDVASVQPEVAEALREVPEARPYVNTDGDFDYGAARSELGRVEASSLRVAWEDALSKATAEA